MPDYVKKEDVIGELKAMAHQKFCVTNLYINAVIDMEDAIKKMPPADINKQEQGKWIKDNNRPRSWIYKCSVCDGIAYYPSPKFNNKGCLYTHCPNCGARMVT